MNSEEHPRGTAADLCLIYGSVFFLVGMEWLFLSTSESFLLPLSWFERARILFALTALTFLPLLVVLLVVHFLSAITSRVLRSAVALALAVLTLGISFLLLFENFTYTIWGFNVFFFTTYLQYTYILIFLILLRLAYLFLRPVRSKLSVGKGKLLSPIFIACFALGIIDIAVLSFRSLPAIHMPLEAQSASAAAPAPDIYLIGTDMVPADRMSIYGYERNTTPFLQKIEQDLLVFENAYSNGNHSLSTILTLLTGKHPLTFGVLHYPHLLNGSHAYQHLPGLLRNLGYSEIELSERRYADSHDANMRNGFHQVNYRHSACYRYPLLSRSRSFNSSIQNYSFWYLLERISLRVGHIFGLRTVEHTQRRLWWPIQKQRNDDSLAWNELQHFIERKPQPIFAHLHLTDTHGPRYKEKLRFFSKGKKQEENYDKDFFDDAILAFDQELQQFVEYLSQSKRLKNSIIFIYSDHPPSYALNTRLPLILYAPGRNITGRVTANVQMLDVAPTVLGLLDHPIPHWMEGQDLLDKSLDLDRWILSVGSTPPTFRQGGWPDGKPPFRLQLGALQCSFGFTWQPLLSREVQEQPVGHAAHCIPRSAPSAEQALSQYHTFFSMNGIVDPNEYLRAKSLMRPGDSSSQTLGSMRLNGE